MARTDEIGQKIMTTGPGWYDDGSGRQRWWDGHQWTAHVTEPSEAGAGAPEVAATTEEQHGHGGRKPKRRVPLLALLLTALGALALGMVIATAAASGSSGEASLENKVAEQATEIEELKETVASDQAAMDQLAEDKAELDQRSADLDKREQDISAQERKIEENTIPGDGVYLVGEDVQPGTYRNDGTSGCYWARLSGTSGTLDDILANDNVSGQAIVTIAPSDVAFETSGCGNWKLAQ